MQLSDKALLVHLSVSQWMGRKLDKGTSNQIASMNNADPSAGRYTKCLLPTCSELKDVHSKAALIRKEFYKNTLPWGIDGTFILPSANYLEFIAQFRSEKCVWEQLLEDFLSKYHGAVVQAQRMLGNLFDPAQYPDVNVVRSKFRMDLTFMPVPTADDFRVELIDSELAVIKADVVARAADAQTAAMNEVWQRLYVHVEKIAERLGNPENVFHDTMIENAREACELLARLNIADDPNLEALRQQVRDKLVCYTPDTLRSSPDVRRQAATDAAAIKSAMGAFMGGGV